MIRIGIVLAKTPGYSETFFRNKINGLKKEGFDVTILAPKGKDYDKNLYPGVKIRQSYRVSSNWLIQLLRTLFCIVRISLIAPRAVMRFFSLERADGKSALEVFKSIYLNAHILSSSLDWLHFGFATMGLGRENVAKAIGAKSAVSFRGYDISIYPITHVGCYDLLFKKIDKVHSISDDLYSEALTLGLSREKPYVKIPPAIDCNSFKIADNSECKNDIPIYVSIGRLTWKKGFEYSIHALGKLNMDFRYYIIGEGEDLERLIYAAYQEGIGDKVVFTGKKTPIEVSNILQNCDLYLQPSVQEGFCNAVLEAQACGALCIVSDAEGLAENVEDGKSGFVVPKRDAEAMADIIKTVSALDIQKKREITTYASRRVNTQFDVRNQIAAFIDFYAL